VSIADSVRLLDMVFPVHGNHKIADDGMTRRRKRLDGSLGDTGGMLGKPNPLEKGDETR